MITAAFGRLCVETMSKYSLARVYDQPPSGGCVLKQNMIATIGYEYAQPPSGGCVLKQQSSQGLTLPVAAAFGRLCVET